MMAQQQQQALEADSRWHVQGYLRGTVPAALRARVVADLVRGLPELRVAAYFELNPAWFESFEHLSLLRVGDGVAGVLASVTDREAPACLRLTTIFLCEAVRGSSALWSLLRHHLVFAQARGAFPNLVVLKTCNPGVFSAMRSFTRVPGVSFFPALVGPQDAELEALAARVARRLCPAAEFDAATGVLRRVAVPPDFYASIPQLGPPPVRAHFSRHLTPEDRFLCLAHLRDDSARERVIAMLDR